MTKYKALYQGMYDDLKDSEMMIDYACCIKWDSPEDKPLADEIAKYAKSRLDHFSTFKKLLEDEIVQEPEAASHSVADCLWGETMNHMLEWHEKIQKKINKY